MKQAGAPKMRGSELEHALQERAWEKRRRRRVRLRTKLAVMFLHGSNATPEQRLEARRKLKILEALEQEPWNREECGFPTVLKP